ncbi:NADH:quinone oxidoreductase [Methylophaga nitratireducenticrescens]|uniref:NADH-ubiquinone oxidoreductase, chain 4L n=1 Tax=Methylophaga nitratireducenticrescens TaxID=754476 RepID=I1XHP5_METNJ|nr:NADH-quinone oxidoreductase subunit K [Methylophaga nitratireducenticrescens]AFI83914.1 NADH:quinone oxidoreductase [Methylophaga nitratireducenticrescens]
MTAIQLYLCLGVSLWGLGSLGLFLANNFIRRIININIAGNGVFMVMVALASREETIDPVLQALVVTGLVVAVCATAFALRLSVGHAQSKQDPER